MDRESIRGLPLRLDERASLRHLDIQGNELLPFGRHFPCRKNRQYRLPLVAASKAVVRRYAEGSASLSRARLSAARSSSDFAPCRRAMSRAWRKSDPAVSLSSAV